jgi:hypothetical protein
MSAQPLSTPFTVAETYLEPSEIDHKKSQKTMDHGRDQDKAWIALMNLASPFVERVSA